MMQHPDNIPYDDWEELWNPDLFDDAYPAQWSISLDLLTSFDSKVRDILASVAREYVDKILFENNKERNQWYD